MKHYIDFHEDVGFEELDKLLKIAIDMKAKTKQRIPHHYLEGQSLAMIFTKSSTRTRVSFEVGMYQLGGQALFLSSNDIQIGRGETIHDTARVLSGMVDGIMIRTYAHQDIVDLAKYGSIPVINGLSDDQHPTQMLADLLTIKEHFGDYKGIKLTYMGDARYNMANSLMIGCAKMGVDVAIVAPGELHPESQLVKLAEGFAKEAGSSVLITDDVDAGVKNADVIYTDVWASMGEEAKLAERIKLLKPYQVNASLMAKTGKKSIFMHCLPAVRNNEVTPDVIDGSDSVVWDEAENRKHTIKAVMAATLGEI